MFTLDAFVLVKCTYFIWISDGHRGFGLRLFPLCFACFALFSSLLFPAGGVWLPVGDWEVLRVIIRLESRKSLAAQHSAL